MTAEALNFLRFCLSCHTEKLINLLTYVKGPTAYFFIRLIVTTEEHC